MTEENTTETIKESKRPTHEVFQINGDDDKARWTKIGIAFSHKDGKGMSIFLHAVPLTGRTVVRLIEPKQEKDTGGQQ